MVRVWAAAAWLVASIGLGGQAPERAPSEVANPEPEVSRQILKLRRVYVDRFGGGETALQLRDMIIGSLQSAGLFVITENEERADAVLRGSAEDLVFTDTFSSSDSLNARTAVGTGSNPDRTATDRRGRSANLSVGESESIRTAERKHEATASVRLVNKNGDVIWSTTQESQGSKFRGASADVAYKITRQLVRDYDRARKPPASK